MAATLRLDGIRKARVETRLILEPQLAYEVTIFRHAFVLNIPLSSGDSDHSVLLKALSVPGMPQLGESHPNAAYAFAFVQAHQVSSYSVSDNTVDIVIVYRGPFVPTQQGGGVFFTVAQAPITNVVDVRATINRFGPQQNLRIWYDPGKTDIVGGNVEIVKGTPESGSQLEVIDLRNFSARKVRVTQSLRATAIVTKAQWNQHKFGWYAAKGMVNHAPWGDYGVGTWLCLGPAVRNYDSAGNTLAIELGFIEGDPDWFWVEVYRDLFGNIPPDIVSEKAMRDNGLPVEGGQMNGNGITIASIYGEEGFNELFGFVPYP